MARVASKKKLLELGYPVGDKAGYKPRTLWHSISDILPEYDVVSGRPSFHLHRHLDQHRFGRHYLMAVSVSNLLVLFLKGIVVICHFLMLAKRGGKATIVEFQDGYIPFLLLHPRGRVLVENLNHSRHQKPEGKLVESALQRSVPQTEV
jgi:hypothetical protein